MKNLWNKIPAWLKAILLNIFLLYPIVMVVQTVISLNFQTWPAIPWTVAVVGGLLALFFWLARRFARFTQPEDVRLKLGFDMTKTSNWSYLLGIFLLTPSIITLAAYAFQIDSNLQLQYILSFKALSPLTAVPLLIVLAFSAGLIEEVVYRGYIQNTLTRSYPKWVSFVLIGVTFSVMHFLPFALMIPYLIVSIIFSFVADRAKATGVVIVGHFLVDAASFLTIYFFPTLFDEPTFLIIGILVAMLVVGSVALLLPTRFRFAAKPSYELTH